MNNSIIPIFPGTISGELIQLANARDLHQFLAIGKDFSNWIKDRIKQYGFQENSDYIRIANNGGGVNSGFQPIEYHITIDMAKELSMVERNEKGKEARKYFIECERQAQIKHEIRLPRTFSEALRLLADETEAKEAAQAQIEADKPKVEFAMAVRNLEGSCLVREFAKAIGTGQNKLFSRLRDLGYLMPNNIPYQRYLDNGYFVVTENTPFTDRDGKTYPSFTTRITGKGQVALEKKLRTQDAVNA